MKNKKDKNNFQMITLASMFCSMLSVSFFVFQSVDTWKQRSVNLSTPQELEVCRTSCSAFSLSLSLSVSFYLSCSLSLCLAALI